MRLRLDESVTRQKIAPGTVRRILPYAKRYRWAIAILLFVTAVDAVITVAQPLLLRLIIDDGILPRKLSVAVTLTATIAALALVDAVAVYILTWASARIGQGLIYDLRTEVFNHVQRQSLAFFTRTQTGSLVSRLTSDVFGAQQAITVLLAQVVSTILTLILALVAMFYLSWQISVLALILIPLFIVPGRLIGKRMQRLTRQEMQQDAELGSMMNERFNVAGAMLTKLYGRPETESGLFSGRAAQVRDVAILSSVWGRALFISLTLVSALITALTYGLGSAFVINRVFPLGTLVAMVTLLPRLYNPINQLSGMQANVMTTLVSFDRIFEVLNLKPSVVERPGAIPLPAAPGGRGSAPPIEFDRVSFRYPAASEVSLASLESIHLPEPERADVTQVLRETSFHAPGGKLTALVGPSGAGKTTITHLAARLFDPGEGVVRIGDRDLRDLTLESLREAVGVVTQDAHLFHDTIRANLTFARPGATEPELVESCRAARIWDMISALPGGLDTVVGDRGYRLSGGEKQRIALARLLLKAPPIVILDEATAHLDSESEAAIQRALKTALAGRTSLVIAHRLSTIREADQILVVDQGRITERGTHEELLASGGLYAELYYTQFSRQDGDGPESADFAAAAVLAAAAPGGWPPPPDDGPRGPRMNGGPGRTGSGPVFRTPPEVTA
jgi:ATP-binding cassette, subfamily B, bacterial